MKDDPIGKKDKGIQEKEEQQEKKEEQQQEKEDMEISGILGNPNLEPLHVNCSNGKYEDKTLTCKECGKEFVFTASEQEFFASKGFQNEPGRCPACRAIKKQQRPGRTGAGERRMFPGVACNTNLEEIKVFENKDIKGGIHKDDNAFKGHN